MTSGSGPAISHVTFALGACLTAVPLPAGSGFVTGNVGGPSCDPLDPPLSVLLTDFEATVQPDHVLVSWRTLSEANNQGFNLYRSTSADDLGELLGYVPSSAPGSTQGAAYQWQDAIITTGVTYFYTLQDIDLAGVTTLHGSVSATPQAPTA